MQLIGKLYSRPHVTAVIAIGLAAVFALAVSVGSTEAADDYGDSAVIDGGVVVDPENATGMDDLTVARLEPGSSLTISFGDNVAYNGAGDDITLHFADLDGTSDGTVELSQDGITFGAPLAIDDSAAALSIDLGSLPFVTAVRITNDGVDANNIDLDAVEATNGFLLEDVTIDLDPAEAMNDILEMHDVTATVDDGAPIEGAELTWEITEGPQSDAPSIDTTDALGESQLSYTGNNGAGTDTITAYLDINGNGAADEGEPIGFASKRWLGVSGTIDLTDIDGGMVALGDVLTVSVEDSDLDLTDALDTVLVLVTSSSDGAGFMLELTETGVHSGIFEGSIFLADVTDSNAFELAAVVGDDITATYDDELDDSGADPVPVEASLFVETDVDEAGDKVTLCHVPGGNPDNQHTISVGAPARDAHLAHGDSLGECGEEGDPAGAAQAAHGEKPAHDFCDKRVDHPRCAGEAGEQSNAETLGVEELDHGEEDEDEEDDEDEKDKKKKDSDDD